MFRPSAHSRRCRSIPYALFRHPLRIFYFFFVCAAVNDKIAYGLPLSALFALRLHNGPASRPSLSGRVLSGAVLATLAPRPQVAIILCGLLFVTHSITPLGLVSCVSRSARVLFFAVFALSLTLCVVGRGGSLRSHSDHRHNRYRSFAIGSFTHPGSTRSQPLAHRSAVASFRVQCSLRSHLALRSPLSYVGSSSLSTMAASTHDSMLS